MSSFDDLPLDASRDATEPVAPSAQSSPGPRIAAALIAALVLVAAGAWIYTRPTRGTPAAATSPATAPPAASVADATPPETPLPPLAEMDPVVRELVAALSTHPAVLAWLATDDLVSSLVTAVDRLAQGQSPARDLAVLRPTQGFATTRRAGVTRVDPASYARYAPLAQAVASVDPQRAADVLIRLRPRLDEAYRAHGHPEGGFDDALRRAIATIATAPDPPDDAALVAGPGGYRYADPAFEGRPPAQKHLARMGPNHLRTVREAARRFGAALDARAAAR